MGFIRVKLLQAEAGAGWDELGTTFDPFCSVHIKEAIEVPGQGIQLVQKKKTIYPDWNKCFDTHQNAGRVITVAVMSKHDNKLVGDCSVGVQFLADQCKKSGIGVSSVWVRKCYLCTITHSLQKHQRNADFLVKCKYTCLM